MRNVKIKGLAMTRIGIVAVVIGMLAIGLGEAHALGDKSGTDAGDSIATTRDAPPFTAADEQTVNDPTRPTLTRLDLAIMHVEYLFLDEVVAGRGGAITPEVEMALARLDYLLQPEVIASEP